MMDPTVTWTWGIVVIIGIFILAVLTVQFGLEIVERWRQR